MLAMHFLAHAGGFACLWTSTCGITCVSRHRLKDAGKIKLALLARHKLHVH